jgi:hypothetical protein
MPTPYEEYMIKQMSGYVKDNAETLKNPTTQQLDALENYVQVASAALSTDGKTTVNAAGQIVTTTETGAKVIVQTKTSTKATGERIKDVMGDLEKLAPEEGMSAMTILMILGVGAIAIIGSIYYFNTSGVPTINPSS